MNERLFDGSAYKKGPANSANEKDVELAERYADLGPEYANYNVQSHEIVVNEDRVDSVFDDLLEAYTNNRYPYNQESTRLPHDSRHMPPSLERGSTDHAMFMWCACYYMRGGEKSVSAFVKLSKMYEAYPHLFDCESAAFSAPEEVLEALKFSRLGGHKSVPDQWVKNAGRMLERYEGDPRNIFANVDSYEGALSTIKNDNKGEGFIGFREKMVSMITYYLMDEGLIEYFNFPIPVDMHVTRVSIANKLIEFPNLPFKTNLYSEAVQSTIRKISLDYTQRRGIDPLRLCNAVWLLSESLCGRYPGNVTFEPLGRDNRKGRSTVLVPQEVDVNDPQQQKAYAASCLQCPIQETCEFSVPGKHTYISGGIFIRGKRVRFPLPVQESMDLDQGEKTKY